MSTVFNENEKIWSGPKKSPNYPITNIAAKCLSVLMEDPDHIAQIFHPSGRQYTNSEIVTMSLQVAEHFRDRLKIAPGTIIGLCAGNSDYVVPLFFGSLLAGVVLNPSSHNLDKDGIRHIYSVTQPAIMLCDGDVHDKVSEALDEIQLKIPIYTMRRHIAGVPEITEFLQPSTTTTFRPDDWQVDAQQLGLILWSSGTTGLPKAVCISHGEMLYSCWVTPYWAAPFKRKFALTWLYWLTGYMHIVSCVLKKSTNVTLEENATLQGVLDIVQRYKIDWLFAPPSIVARLAADPQLETRNLSSLRVIESGGSAIIMSHIEKVKAFLPNTDFFAIYGLTEITWGARGLAKANGCVGQLMYNTDVKIIDDMGKRLGPNERGEICIKSPITGPKYYKNPAASAITFIDGWVHSGDIGYFDEDNDLFVVERKKDIIRCEYLDIAPSEMEVILYQLKGVEEACVFGIPHPRKIALPAAAVVLTPESDLTEKDIVDYMAANTAEYKHLEGGVFILPDALPKTATGKVIRKAVFNICQQIWKKQSE